MSTLRLDPYEMGWASLSNGDLLSAAEGLGGATLARANDALARPGSRHQKAVDD